MKFYKQFTKIHQHFEKKINTIVLSGVQHWIYNSTRGYDLNVRKEGKAKSIVWFVCAWCRKLFILYTDGNIACLNRIYDILSCVMFSLILNLGGYFALIFILLFCILGKSAILVPGNLKSMLYNDESLYIKLKRRLYVRLSVWF